MAVAVRWSLNTRPALRGRLKVMYKVKTCCPVEVDTRIRKGIGYGLVY